jgi:predicted phosphohydrolase
MAKEGGTQLIWVTDPHLNFVSFGRWERWIESIKRQNSDGLLITGDITEAEDLTFQLERIVDHLQIPIYFVLGNHDYYRGSIASVRERIDTFCRQSPNAIYLTHHDPIAFDSGWVLVGHDGWADGLFGNAQETTVRLNDFRLIGDYSGLTYQEVLEMMAMLARQASEELSMKLEAACSLGTKVLIATHVPPFSDACLYNNLPSDDQWLPFFASKTIGDCCLAFANRFPSHLFHVVCGHSHHRARVRITNNLTVWTGGAEYREPAIERVIDLGNLANELL